MWPVRYNITASHANPRRHGKAETRPGFLSQRKIAVVLCVCVYLLLFKMFPLRPEAGFNPPALHPSGHMFYGVHPLGWITTLCAGTRRLSSETRQQTEELSRVLSASTTSTVSVQAATLHATYRGRTRKTCGGWFDDESPL